MDEEDRERLLDWVESGGRLVIGVFGDVTGLPNMLSGGAASVGDYLSMTELLGDLGLVLAEEDGGGYEGEVVTRSEITRDVNVVGVPSAYRLGWLGHGAREGVGKPREDVAVGSDAVVMSVGLGEGMIHVLADVEMVANAEIGKNDNAILAANLVFADGAPDVVYFREPLADGELAFPGEEDEPVVDAGPLNNVVLALLAIAIIYALGRAQRFGAPVPPDDDTRRARSDHVRAFAEIYARAQAGGAAAQMLATGLRRRMSHAAGTTPAAPVERIAERLDQRGLPGAGMAALLAELASTGTNPTEKELIRLARRITEYERML